MRRVSDVFKAWPSDADLGRDLSVPYPTIAAWKQRDSIPAAYWRDIIGAARKRGHPEITADLLVDLHALEPRADRTGFGEEERQFDTQDRTGANEKRTGHFSRFKHLRRDHFRTAAEIQQHIEKLRDEWSHR